MGILKQFHVYDPPLLLWELPQNLMGLIFFLYMKFAGTIDEVDVTGGRVFIKGPAGISLGFFIFWAHDERNEIFHIPEVNREHEYGHSVQSRILGPLYLPLIGIPSVLRVFYARWYHHRHKIRWTGYYRGYPENWADRLGGVDSTAGKRTG